MKKYIDILSNKIETNKKPLYFADFETIIFNNRHIISCYSLSSEFSKMECDSLPLDVNNDNCLLKSEQLVEQFLKVCFKCKDNSIIYFHNFGKFDSIFILHKIFHDPEYTINIISRRNIFYEVKIISKDKKTIIFRDSYLLFPKSLVDFGQTFAISKILLDNKIKFNHNITLEDFKTKKFILEYKTYCINDTLILQKAFSKYYAFILKQFGINLIECLTLASLSFKIFRKNYYPNKIENYPIFKSYGNNDNFIRESYRGGIVDTFKPYLENGYHYDINSLYPYIMKTFSMPISNPKYIRCDNTFNIDKFFGFIKVNVVCPKDVYIPALAINHPQYGLISPTGEFSGVFFSEEIKYALSLNCGYKFEYIKGYSFDQGILFDEYVTDLYNLRVKHKNTSLDSIIKLLMNSLYGRFGMSPNNRQTKVLNLNNQLDSELYYKLEAIQSLDEIARFDNICIISQDTIKTYEQLTKELEMNVISTEEYSLALYQNDLKNNISNIAVHVASAITAYARIHIHKYKLKYQENLYYSDTDSLIVSQPIDDSDISETELGKFKLEERIEIGYFIAPKLYFMKINNTLVKSKTKGLDVNSKLTLEDFQKLFEGKGVVVKDIKNSFFKDLQNFFVKEILMEINISGVFVKREKEFNNKNVWINTKPLHLTKN